MGSTQSFGWGHNRWYIALYPSSLHVACPRCQDGDDGSEYTGADTHSLAKKTLGSTRTGSAMRYLLKGRRADKGRGRGKAGVCVGYGTVEDKRMGSGQRILELLIYLNAYLFRCSLEERLGGHGGMGELSLSWE